MTSVVFDASAVLALIGGEPGADIVTNHIDHGIISAVNLQEIIKELLRRSIPLDNILEIIDALHLNVRVHGRDEAIAAAALYSATKEYGSGLGDRSCMALAIAEKIPALTADHSWTKVKMRGLKIKLIR